MKCEFCKQESKNWFKRIFYKNNTKIKEVNNCCICDLTNALTTFFNMQVTNPVYAKIIENKARHMSEKFIDKKHN